METPLYDSLKQLAESNPLRFHLPGHKGKTLPYLQDLVSLDFTELSATGSLYEVTQVFDQAQSLWAMEFGFPHCQFLTGGSTQGVATALALCAKEGEQILLDRGAHRSATHAVGLLGLEPVYWSRPWLSELEVPNAMTPDSLEALLKEHPNIKTVFLTSPTVCGILSDVYSLAQIVHDHGGKLIVDGAHGAHLPWLMIDNYSAADVVCVSAHKTLPTLGQSSMLFFREFQPKEVAEIASLFGTSSPSYMMMASMDAARQWMNEDGMMEYVRVARQVATLREIFPSLSEPLFLDPTRLTLVCNQGQQVANELEKKGIYLEMANPGHLVAVFTALDTDAEIHTLAKALIPHLAHRRPVPDLSPPSTLPQVKLSVRQAIFSPKETIPLSQALGRTAAVNIAPFPPGIPVVVMGEEITQEALTYLQLVGFDKDEILVVK